MTDQLRAGIVGAGFAATVHARAIRAAGGAVTRVAASTPERSAAAAAAFGAWAADTAEAVIDAPDVDVVHICTPNSLHAPLARRALAAGKAVVCEKPLALDPDDARDLASLAHAAGVVATVPYVYRFYPMLREARARIAAGEAGALRLLHGGYLQDWQAGGAAAGWRGDPGEGGALRAFADVGVHWCDLVEFVSGHRIARLVARVRGGGVETVVLGETDRGAGVSVVVSQAAPGRGNQLTVRVEGDLASYDVDQERPETLRVGTIEGTRELRRTAGSPYARLPVGHPQGYQDGVDAFVADTHRALRGPAPDGLPTFDDGARSAALLHAVTTSHARSAWVEVPA